MPHTTNMSAMKLPYIASAHAALLHQSFDLFGSATLLLSSLDHSGGTFTGWLSLFHDLMSLMCLRYVYLVLDIWILSCTVRNQTKARTTIGDIFLRVSSLAMMTRCVFFSFYLMVRAGIFLSLTLYTQLSMFSPCLCLCLCSCYVKVKLLFVYISFADVLFCHTSCKGPGQPLNGSIHSLP
ncbi:hypothetical protein BDW74DRAFT_15920 [Aspergillus multicolor]|uniref:uncharacterized protein n=1 Tax=Aspergillus multicolor TaxID=41759 RepID=UPI003CCCE69B